MPKGHFARTEAHKQNIATATKASWTDERKQKASERGSPWNVGRVYTDDERLVRAIAATGKVHTQEAKDKISAAKKGKRQFPGALFSKYGITEEVYWQKKDAGFKWCSGCRDFLLLERFTTKNTLCRDCDAINKKLRWDALPEQEQKRRKQVQYQRQKDQARNTHLQKSYGVTAEWYDAQFEKQGGKCAICKGTNQQWGQKKADGTKYRLAVDHDHVTGQARKLLCQLCNLMLDVIENHSDWHPLAQAYLAECSEEALVGFPS
jgi:Recombination endonuclease VII/NUMOD3 motif